MVNKIISETLSTYVQEEFAINSTISFKTIIVYQ